MGQLDAIIRAFGHLPCWGVVSTYAAESFYDELTWEQALAKSKEEEKEEGRVTSIVLVACGGTGMPGTSLEEIP